MHSRSDPRRLARNPQQRDPREVGKIISRRVTAMQAAERYGLQPDRHGFCRCPIHGDNDKSLKVYPEDRGWYCFGCGKGGDAISLVRHLHGLPYAEAVAMLDRDFGLGLLNSGIPTPPADTILRRERDRQQAEDAVEQRLWEISRTLHDIYALPQPRPDQHDWARAYAQILAYAEYLEYEKEAIHHQNERALGANDH